MSETTTASIFYLPPKAVAAPPIQAGPSIVLDKPKPKAPAAPGPATPPPPQEPVKKAGTVDFEGGRFVLRGTYDARFVELMKSWPKPRPRWDGGGRCWSIGTSLPEVEELVRFSQKLGYHFTPGGRTALEQALANARARIASSEASSLHDQQFEGQLIGLQGLLHPFQKAGAKYVVETKRCIVGDEPGLGKTVQALAALHVARAFPAVVVCPASMKEIWRREIQKWLPARSVQVVNGSNGSIGYADITICNYDVLGRVLDFLKHALKPRAVVLDESHYIKNPQAKRTKAAIALCDGADYRILLTGTMIINRPREAKAQLRAIGKLEEFGGDSGFDRRYCPPAGPYDRTGGHANLDELHRRLRASCYIRRRKSEVLKELPPKTRSIIPVPLANEHEYRQAEADIVGWLKQHGGNAEAARRAEEIVRITKLKQLAARGKLEAAAEWVDTFLESGEKLVLFAHHLDVIAALEDRFKAYNPASIKGSDDSVARLAAIEKFQKDPSCRLFVGGLTAAGVGITLTAASNVAFLELGWTPAVHDQAEDRVHRIGQDNAVNAWYLLAEQTIDEDIWDILNAKRRVVSTVHDGAPADMEASIVRDVIGRLMRRGEK